MKVVSISTSRTCYHRGVATQQATWRTASLLLRIAERRSARHGRTHHGTTPHQRCPTLPPGRSLWMMSPVVTTTSSVPFHTDEELHNHACDSGDVIVCVLCAAGAERGVLDRATRMRMCSVRSTSTQGCYCTRNTLARGWLAARDASQVEPAPAPEPAPALASAPPPPPPPPPAPLSMCVEAVSLDHVAHTRASQVRTSLGCLRV